MLNFLLFCPLALENGRGGEISSMELASGLSKYYKVTFVDTNQFTGEKLLSKEVIRKKLKDVKFQSRMKFATINFSNKIFTFPYPWEIYRMYKLIKKQDIIYASCSTFKNNLMFMIFSLLHRRAKYIIGYRKPLFSEKLISLYNIKYRLSILFFSIFKKRFYHHTLSKNAKRFLNKFYEPERVIHIIHGIDLKDYIEEREEGNDKDILKFVYIGYLDDIHKGVNVLINAIDELLDERKDFKISFEICGMGPLESRLRELQMKYPQFIKFHGYVSNDLISEYYKKGDVYLFTSRVEPLPRAIMEALGAKLVILSSKTIGSVELLKGKDFAFFIKDLTSKSIKEKIWEIINLWNRKPEEFKQLQKKAKKFVFENYSFTKELEMFKTLFEKISRFKTDEIIL